MPKGTKQPSDFTRAIAAEIRMEAALQGLKQSDLADGAGISRSAFNKLWHGASVIDSEQLAATARVLGVTVTTLTGRAEARLR